MAKGKVNKHSAVIHTKGRRKIDKRGNEDESSLKGTVVVNHANGICQIDSQDSENSVLKLRLSSLKKQKFKFKEFRGPSFKQIVNQYPDTKFSPKLKRMNLNPEIVVADNAFQNYIKSFVKLKERLSKVSWSEETKKNCFKITCSDCKIYFNVMNAYVKNLENLKAKVSQLKFWNEDDPQNCRISITTTVNNEIVAESAPNANDKNENNQTNNSEVGITNKSKKLKLAKESEEFDNIDCANDVQVPYGGEEKQAANTNESEINIDVQCEDEKMEVTNVYDSNIKNTKNIHSSNENQNCIPNVSNNIPHPSFQNIFNRHKNVNIPEAVLQCNVAPVIMLESMDVVKWYEEEVNKLRHLVNVRGINSHTTESQSLPSCRNEIELENCAEKSSCIALPSNTNAAELQNHNDGADNSDTLKESFSYENNEYNGGKEVKRNSNGRQPLITEWFQKSSVVPQKQMTITQQQQHENSQQHSMLPKISHQTVTLQEISQYAKSQLQPIVSCSMPQVHTTISQSQPQLLLLQQQQRYPYLTEEQHRYIEQQVSHARRQPILRQPPIRINILRNRVARHSHPYQNIRSINLPTYRIIPPAVQNNSNTQNQPIRLQLNSVHNRNITDNASNSPKYLRIIPTLDLMEM